MESWCYSILVAAVLRGAVVSACVLSLLRPQTDVMSWRRLHTDTVRGKRLITPASVSPGNADLGLHCIELTNSMQRVLLEKLIVTQIVKFLACYGTPRVITQKSLSLVPIQNQMNPLHILFP